MQHHRHRHEGLRWSLYAGAYHGIEQVAVDELQTFIQQYMPYVIECRPGDAPHGAEPGHSLVVGTPGNNPRIAALINDGLLARPPAPESYACRLIPADAPDKPCVLAIAGFDPKGVLNGVVEVCARLAARPELCALTLPDARQAFDTLMASRESFPSALAGQDPALAQGLTEAPVIENRGIWTWGYVIHDYQRFLDNMARLKMNMLVIWNDAVPVNIHDVVAYARQRGIRLIAGFHWGWGLPSLSLVNREHLAAVKRNVLELYARDYQDAGFDGIYFQTNTEHHDLTVGGVSTAAAACAWVNEIGRALLD
jgi:hypothetical protein